MRYYHKKYPSGTGFVTFKTRGLLGDGSLKYVALIVRSYVRDPLPYILRTGRIKDELQGTERLI